MLNHKLDNNQLNEKSCKIRKNIIDVCVKNGAGHIAPSFSCVDILTALYYNILNLSNDPEWEDRDRLVFSKAHGCYGLYAILSDISYISRNSWNNFYVDSDLSGCAERNTKKGIEASCGSLGHGLPMAVGIAFGAKLQKKEYKVYCIIGDGEMQEGSNWEAIQFAVKYNLSNLILIVDNNKLQAMDFIENILTVEEREDDLKIKLNAFGFEVLVCDGHNPQEIIKNIKAFKSSISPKALVAKTIKGYGLSCMENIPKFHFRLPTEDELKQGNRYE
jgi:transketolase